MVEPLHTIPTRLLSVFVFSYQCEVKCLASFCHDDEDDDDDCDNGSDADAFLLR